MAGVESLKRLGGGRWATRDGRFTIEPESGTWVIVDTEQTDELGLPLVRGPFPSLTAAREAIDSSRGAGPAESPLAERIERARRSEPPPPTGRPRRARREVEPETAPKAPPVPPWLRRLDDADRKRVRDIVRRLEKAGVEDAEAVARAEVADDEPALARLALERRLAAAAEVDQPADAVRALVDALLGGRDTDLGARWRLTDGAGREIRRLDLPEPGRPERRRE